jgi:hypothetical protein
MSNMSRGILVSLAAATVTIVLTMVIAAIIDYAWVYGSSDPSRFDTLGWMFIYGWPILVIQLFIPAIIVGIVAGVFSKIWLSKKRRIRSWVTATMTFVLTVVIVAITSYAWVHGSSGPSQLDTRLWMFVRWPILVFPLFIPAIIAGIVAAAFPRYD